jgi:hypothetical protein
MRCRAKRVTGRISGAGRIWRRSQISGVLIATTFALGGCGSGGTHPLATRSSPQKPSPQSEFRSQLTKIAAICINARERIAQLQKPATQDPSSPAALAYERQVATVLDRSLAQAADVAQSVPGLNIAFNVGSEWSKDG